MSQLFTNNAGSTLAAGITAVATSVSLAAGEGARFPNPAAGDDFLITVFQRIGTQEQNWEIMRCTARAGDVLTVVRGHEGTTARAFNGGDFVELRLTAGAVLPMRAGALVSALNEAPTVTMASATSMAIGAAAANSITVTGTTTITTFDAIGAGAIRYMTFAGALTLTHDVTKMILIGGANIITVAGDTSEWVSQGAGVWRMTRYTRANGDPVTAVSVARGGTGATTAAAARTALNVPAIDAPAFTGNVSVTQTAAEANITLNSAASYARFFYRSADGMYGVYTSDGTTAATRLRFSGMTGPITIGENGGNVTIGTTVDDGVNKLQVSGTVKATSFVGNVTGTAANITGIAAVANGGTGVASLAGIAFGNGTGAFSPATSAQIVTSLGYTPVDSAKIGAANGIVPLGADTKIAATYLPSYVDDVLEFAALANFPATGTAGIIYTALDTNKIYRWGGSAYAEISPSPGSTDAVPEGATNKYYTDIRVRATVLTGISLVTNAVIAATDSVLTAFGKLQKQITDLGTSKANLASPTFSGTVTSPTFAGALTGNASTATSSPILSALGNFAWSAATTPSGYVLGQQMSFVQNANGFQNYGSVITTKTYAGGGGSLQMYVPYSPSNGGTGLQVRFGNFDVNSGDSWTAWKTLLQSDNYTDYVVPKTGGSYSGQVLFAEGTASAPGISFANDGSPDTGFYHLYDGAFGITCNGNPTWTFTSGGSTTYRQLRVDTSAQGANYISMSAENTNGLHIALSGGGANPAKTLRLLNGTLDIVNSAYSAIIWSLADDGAMGSRTYTAWSDENKKTNWRALPGNLLEALAAIGKMGLFDWRDNGATSLGVGAQSLETILPDAVATDAEGAKSVNYGPAALVSIIALIRRFLPVESEVAALRKLVEQLQRDVANLKAVA